MFSLFVVSTSEIPEYLQLTNRSDGTAVSESGLSELQEEA